MKYAIYLIFCAIFGLIFGDIVNQIANNLVPSLGIIIILLLSFAGIILSIIFLNRN